ncbi:hypothetical protein ASPBRDRAFT_249598 [Aspergillus brasiliensis CBS 101740]|uniref:Uncharacterized protein n=1 Tax=Aspergillus brasiliensis (strain CBS 101740 / IMI 381727 / IBT 21946) TaxID=767769 RepID=A0A1L9V1W1_ASPBC|nr:hypothetical protein ASPBRDRAFT_249598 [Aspergillus brasiliensis CBS 101740]
MKLNPFFPFPTSSLILDLVNLANSVWKFGLVLSLDLSISAAVSHFVRMRGCWVDIQCRYSFFSSFMSIPPFSFPFRVQCHDVYACYFHGLVAEQELLEIHDKDKHNPSALRWLDFKVDSKLTLCIYILSIMGSCLAVYRVLILRIWQLCNAYNSIYSKRGGA